ncbi:hypothetical protein HYV80_01680 [Candidatus Woesearchaeota archaeon]|nr:hypothetical protein [Candidatus Woesearchaeota archaeon]
MDRNIAERLVAELESRSPLSPEVLKKDRDKLIDLLASTDVPPSKKFYKEVKPNQIYIPGNDSDQHHFLSIRRVLRNDRAREYELSRAKQIYEVGLAALGIHDSDVWTRRLRTNKEIVRMMSQAMVQHGQPYTLVAKLETFEDVQKTVEIMPLVVIPSAQDLQKIIGWEISNARPYRETPFGRIRMSTSWYSRS